MGLRLRGARLGTPFMMPLPPPVGARERMLVSALLACAAFNPAVDLVSKRLCRHAWEIDPRATPTSAYQHMYVPVERSPLSETAC